MEAAIDIHRAVPWARCVAMTACSRSLAKKMTLPGHTLAMAATMGSAWR